MTFKFHFFFSGLDSPWDKLFPAQSYMHSLLTGTTTKELYISSIALGA